MKYVEDAYEDDDMDEDEDDFSPTDDSDPNAAYLMAEAAYFMAEAALLADPDYMPCDESDSESLEDEMQSDPPDELRGADISDDGLGDDYEPLEEEEEEEDTGDADSDSTDYLCADEDGFVEEQTPNVIDSGVPRVAAPATDEAGEGEM